MRPQLPHKSPIKQFIPPLPYSPTALFPYSPTLPIALTGLRRVASGLDLSFNANPEPRQAMTQDMIRYDILAQDALRGVIRKVLGEVMRTGLPGNHHFFITFVTGAPGVRISPRLREKYPEQMTIVLQHQYWDLEVSDTGFEVTLSFSDISEKLVVPYAAIRGFYDPSVNFELEFEVRASGSDNLSEAELAEAKPEKHEVIKAPVKTRTQKPKTDKSAGKKTGDDASGEKPSADVVSLDAFRKK